MKKLFVSILILCAFTCYSQQIKFNISTADPVTGKKMKYTSTDIRIQYGTPIEFIGAISFHEANDDPAIPSGSTGQAKKVVEAYMESYSTHGRMINSVTRLYVSSLTDSVGAPIANHVTLSSYLALKAYNSYPSTAGSDPIWKGMEGICKEMIAVRKANGEFVD